jgi:hypothetical protein
MSQPPDPYQRQFSFTGWSVNHPGEPHQGDKMDIEFNEIRDCLNDTQDRLAEIQEDDGSIKASALPITYHAGTGTVRIVIGGVTYSIPASVVAP